MSSPSLSVVIPVRILDSQEMAVLQKLASDAPSLQVISVGRMNAAVRANAANLQIVDSDCGLYEAMNLGARQASSDYLLFMGIDDVLIAANVDKVIAALDHIANARLVVLQFYVGTRLVKQSATVGRLSSFHHQGVLFHRQTLLDLGGYDARYRLHSDLDLMFRMQQTGFVASLGLPLVSFLKGGMSTSGQHSVLSIREFSAIYRRHGVSRITLGFAFSIALLIWYRIGFVARSLLRRGVGTDT